MQRDYIPDGSSTGQDRRGQSVLGLCFLVQTAEGALGTKIPFYDQNLSVVYQSV